MSSTEARLRDLAPGELVWAPSTIAKLRPYDRFMFLGRLYGVLGKAQWAPNRVDEMMAHYTHQYTAKHSESFKTDHAPLRANRNPINLLFGSKTDVQEFLERFYQRTIELHNVEPMLKNYIDWFYQSYEQHEPAGKSPLLASLKIPKVDPSLSEKLFTGRTLPELGFGVVSPGSEYEAAEGLLKLSGSLNSTSPYGSGSPVEHQVQKK